MIKKITVSSGSSGISSYDVIIGSDILSKCGRYISDSFQINTMRNRRAVIITDSNVKPLYYETAEESIKEADFSDVYSYTLACGESSKSWNVLGDILNFFADINLSRSDIIVALGGGVTGDIAGFAASVYMRGISYVQIPTTLLSMTDSSVGGKTAVNLKAGKNLAGSFYNPRLVLCDINTLDTLPHNIISEGCAEIIKYSFFDYKLYPLIESASFFGVFSKDTVIDLIYECINIKKSLVLGDERDRGKRRLLNFGHTAAHAIEKCSDYKISHGNAVAAGLYIAVMASYRAGYCDFSMVEYLNKCLKLCALRSDITYTADELYKASFTDKKHESGNGINLIYLIDKEPKIRFADNEELYRFFANGTEKINGY